jgi:hypothetical protein
VRQVASELGVLERRATETELVAEFVAILGCLLGLVSLSLASLTISVLNHQRSCYVHGRVVQNQLPNFYIPLPNRSSFSSQYYIV